MTTRHESETTMNRTTIAAFLTACMLGATGARAQDAINDIIQTTQGARLRGVEVVETTSDTIKYKQGGTVSELPATRLLEITWSEPPEEFALGRAALRSGDFATAANMFTEAASKTKRDPLEQECRYQAGAALVRGADDELSLLQLLRVLRRQARLIAISIVLCTALLTVLSLVMTPVYRVEILLAPVVQEQNSALSGVAAQLGELGTLLGAVPAAAPALDRLGFETGHCGGGRVRSVGGARDQDDIPLRTLTTVGVKGLKHLDRN